MYAAENIAQLVKPVVKKYNNYTPKNYNTNNPNILEIKETKKSRKGSSWRQQQIVNTEFWLLRSFYCSKNVSKHHKYNSNSKK